MTDKIKRPSLNLHLSELWRANKERLKAKKLIDNVRQDKRVDGYPVLVIPGFMASEVSTQPMRRLLQRLDYSVYDWGLGRNYARLEDLDHLMQLIMEIHGKANQKITLIGWSLGGVYARRLAISHPELIRRVITLGSPYRHLRAPNYATWLFQLFERFRRNGGHEPDWIVELPKPVSVPSTAFYSKDDGIVPWRATMDPNDPTDHQNIEVTSSHIGLGANEEVLLHLIRILEEDEAKA